ncbi:hypothetical protein M378DRAFT_159662 [Amanita muscaria Koide BX008]|uniref:Uncharacterized protein n=1 Tax=Amanita muscaria (strain Koide BX008) TaxID=946122 RepID=A0A0C2SV08_AMAMK|nr:hypothetical protein M378DRAFT_159662 [Amanita muscaria Koide BX008]
MLPEKSHKFCHSRTCSLGSSNKANRSPFSFRQFITSNKQLPAPSLSVAVETQHSNLSSALLGRYCFVNDFTSRISDLRDGRRNRVTQGEAMIVYAVNLCRRTGTNTQYVSCRIS